MAHDPIACVQLIRVADVRGIPYRPCLHPSCHVVALDRGLFLRRGDVTLQVRDPAKVDFVLHVLAHLDGRTGVEVVRELGLPDLPRTLTILQELDEADLLVDATAAPDQRETCLPMPPDFNHELRRIGFAVLGLGPAGLRATIDLANAGATQIWIADSDQVGEADVGPVYGLEDVGHSRASAAARHLSRMHPDLRCIPFATGAHVLPKAIDLLLACLDGPQLAHFEELNERLWQARVSWLPAFILGEEAICGPMVRPGSSACFRCFELRWMGQSPSVAIESAFFRHLSEGGWRIEAPTARALGNWIGRWAARTTIDCAVGLKTVNQVWIAHLDRQEPEIHRLVPHPSCNVCARAQHVPSARYVSRLWGEWKHENAVETTTANLMSRLEQVRDDRLGLVGQVRPDGPAHPGVSGPALAVYVARFALPQPEYGQGGGNWSHGSAFDPQQAQMIAMVEALERYCGLSAPSGGLVATYEEVADQAVFPPSLPLFSYTQYAQPGFPYLPFRPDLPLSWVWGYSLSRQKSRLVPESAVRFGSSERGILAESSSGVAAHPVRVQALLSGLLEMIERDGLMIYWLNHLSPPLIDLAQLPPGSCRMMIQQIEELGYHPLAANVTTDLGIPSFLALAIREDGRGPALLSGASAALDPITGLEKALREVFAAVLSYSSGQWQLPDPPRDDQVRLPEDHAAAYAHPSRLDRAAFMWASGHSQPLDELPHLSTGNPIQDLSTCLQILDNHRLELIAIDITTPDVARAAIHVTRTVVPGLQPIDFGLINLRLGGERLYSVPAQLGYTTGPTREAELNPFPHFFP